MFEYYGIYYPMSEARLGAQLVYGINDGVDKLSFAEAVKVGLILRN